MSEQKQESSGSSHARGALHASLRMNADRDVIIQEVQAHLDKTLPQAIAQGVADGVRELVSDPEFMKNFWQQGYDNLSKNATVGVKLWLGGRILIIFSTAAFAAAMGWLFVTGKFK